MNRKKTKPAILLGASTILGMALSMPAYSQEMPEDSSAYTLEEIVVTAQKRAENLQNIPVAVTAISAKELNAFQFFDNIDLATQVPNLDVKNPGIPTSNIYLRGIGSSDFNENTNNPVATYVDEVFMSSGVASNVPIFDLERIEVLKGPQGTLYGKNTTGGAISYFSKRPDGEFDARLSVTYGNFDAQRFEGAIAFPIVEDVLSARISFFSSQRDGVATNLYTGTDQNKRNTQAARLQLLYTPNETVEVLLKASANQRRTDMSHGQARGLVNPATGLIDLAAVDSDARLIPGFTNLAGYEDTDTDPFRNSTDGPSKIDIDNYAASATVNVDFGSIALTSITAYQDHKQRLNSDPDTTPTSLLHVERNVDAEQFSQEIRLASNGDDDRLGWIIGAHYFDESLKSNNSFDIFRDLLPPPYFYVNQQYDQSTTSYAGFAHLTYDVSEKLEISAGLRYTYESRDFEQFNDLIGLAPGAPGVEFNGNPGPVIAPLIPLTRLDDSWSEFSGKVAISYQVNSDFLVFGSVARGFKTGGFAGGALTDPLEVGGFDPETLLSDEIGVKSEWFDRRLRVNATAFAYDYSDLQVFIFRPGSAPGTFIQIIENAADAKLYGLELEATVRPTENLFANFGIGLLDSKYVNFIDGQGTDFSGNELTNAPHFNANGIIAYQRPLENGNAFELRSEFNYIGRRFFGRGNTKRLSSGGSHTNVNFSASYFLKANNHDIEIKAWVRNAFEEIDVVEVVDLATVGVDLLFFNDPRTFGVTVNFNY